TLFLSPWFIRKLKEFKVGQKIRTEDCPHLSKLHSQKKDTPTMGGLLILFSMLVSMFLFMDMSHIFTLILLLSTLLFGAIGFADDFLKLKYKNTKGLSGRQKLFFQFLFSGALALYLFGPEVAESLHIGKWYLPPVVKEDASILGLASYASRLYLPFIKEPIVIFPAAFLLAPAIFSMFVVTLSSNAVNLTDGLDGLAAGCLILVAFALSLIAFVTNHIDLASYLNILYIEGSGEIAIYLAAFAGACLGFLWYNAHPAQIIMGDTGSLALGGIIGVSAVLLKRELLLGLIGGIFLAEAVSVILQVGSYKLRNKKRIFLCAPLHHHFEYKGWKETKVVIRFWIIGLLLAIIGILSLKFQ
ncbi:MAG TPA: phospho-N-acetylmuramoyl-pentapeptide-transferase, partial [Parachlamydiaceae bacterium]|nr:phospho-N-acetylmuramoyl-pentapeptide-transferase [Parachlamydiaceae bacterium]